MNNTERAKRYCEVVCDGISLLQVRHTLLCHASVHPSSLGAADGLGRTKERQPLMTSTQMMRTDGWPGSDIAKHGDFGHFLTTSSCARAAEREK